ncbi:hypothetical protein [Natrarchaeobius oligotrophus]|uniref:DUF7982 domain-containing protein n=1 Tax=Natrarchaeobius chitinivorans TaxID=1679083 RepID=A0A3N6MGV3_NATCH|nr:hypothetical protein [Natrarchaeobius chitinivorans]RQH02278.1 hypothetical protein EA472_02965 [Natrarchaeobius chitinivorans]
MTNETTIEPTDADADLSPTESNAADEIDDATRAKLLAAENRRLREAYARSRRSRYRKTAAALAVVGLLALALGALAPSVREVLITLGMTGVFAAAVTYFLTPGRFVSADVGDRIYAAHATNGAQIVDELGLRDDRLYLPDGDGRARLYVPSSSDPDLDSVADRRATTDGPFVLSEPRRGVLLESTGAPLLAEFEAGLPGELGATPTTIAAQLCDGLVEQFELAASADPDVDPAGGRVTVAVENTAFGSLDRFDHPIPAFLAVGLAVGLERPVRLEVAPGGERADWLVTCRFETRSG